MHVVVVLNWHGRDDTLGCVRSVLGSDSDPALIVLVVDNGSFDGTLDELSPLDRVQTLQLPQNIGFSGGMNRGLEWALDAGADTVTVLNNDTIVNSGAMTRLVEIARSGKVAVSPTVMYKREPDRVWFGGGTLDMPDGYPHHTAVADLGPCLGGMRETELLAGCSITASAATWQAAGLFDERFFLNFEDSEWSLRARDRGVRLLVACDVRLLHAVSASFAGAAGTLGSFYFQRNGLLFTTIAGAGTAARLRFLRRFGLDGMRRRTWGERRRALIVTGWALACFILRSFGEAPPALRRQAERWNRRPTG